MTQKNHAFSSPRNKPVKGHTVQQPQPSIRRLRQSLAPESRDACRDACRDGRTRSSRIGTA